MINNSVRIIGGKWRGRKIVFPELNFLRPTHDRIRETLFNWLEPYIYNAVCLDLFAGSGVIGFEALSRGAKTVVMVDQDPIVLSNLQKNRELLAAENSEIIQAKIPAKSFKTHEKQFDIVFLDPPYFEGLVNPSLEWLIQRQLVYPGSIIFIETEIGYMNFRLPEFCRTLKSKKTATIAYHLLEVTSITHK